MAIPTHAKVGFGTFKPDLLEPHRMLVLYLEKNVGWVERGETHHGRRGRMLPTPNG